MLGSFNRRRMGQGLNSFTWKDFVEQNSCETVLDKVVVDMYTLPSLTKAAMSAELEVSAGLGPGCRTQVGRGP